MMFDRIPPWLRITSIIVAVLVGLGSLGFAMPWDALSKKDAANIYETKIRSEEKYRSINDKLDRLQETQDKVLDILLRRTR